MGHAFSFSRERASSSSGGSGVLLFDEDFDEPSQPSDPEVIEPVFSAAEVRQAREEAAQESRDIATAEADASMQAACGLALTEIARQIAETRAEAALLAEQSAEGIARLLLDCFAAAFPALSARHGPGEVLSVVRTILPSLHREPKITIRISPHILDVVTAELRALDPDLAASVRIVPTDAVARGDARIAWESGAAARDTAALWGQIESLLVQTGLMRTEQNAKEYELVE